MASRKNPKAEYIKYKLKTKGSSQTKVAKARSEEVGRKVSWTAVYLTIEGKSESRPIKRIIAKIIGEPIDSLWPMNNEKAA